MCDWDLPEALDRQCHGYTIGSDVGKLNMCTRGPVALQQPSVPPWYIYS